jgi:oxalate decarboxylase/phosphoglucose isomerase-like protein (cupin superfamily)
MKGVEKISHQGIDYAIVLRADAGSEDKYNFLTDPQGPLQLGVNFYTRGETISNHYHHERDMPRVQVQEFILVSAGQLVLKLFDDQQRQFTSVTMESGDAVLLLRGGHGFDILDDTKIVEIKQGPYIEAGDKVVF